MSLWVNILRGRHAVWFTPEIGHWLSPSRCPLCAKSGHRHSNVGPPLHGKLERSWFAEAIATFGLLLTILGCSARTPSAVPYAVGLYITSAYWFTASTSFANPAVTIARSLSDTFAGIAPTGIVAFIAAQFVGMLGAVMLGSWLWRE
jgi:glycerol uptake facilitator-like aquaporin